VEKYFCVECALKCDSFLRLGADAKEQCLLVRPEKPRMSLAEAKAQSIISWTKQSQERCRMLKKLAARYGRVALVALVFAFVAGIVAGPLLQKAGLRPSVTASQDQPAPELFRAKIIPVSGG
jgi:hypothetical protein